MFVRNVGQARSLVLALAVVTALAGCTPAAATPSAAQPTPAATPIDSPAESQLPPASLWADAPAWLSMELTDVTTGEKFTIAGLGSQAVLIENMAQWCPTCRSQAGEVKALRQAFADEEGLAIVSLDVDVNEDAASLKAYAAQAGFDWRFAVAPPDVLREMADLYGSQYLNPPSAPMLLVNSKGAVLPLPFGVKSAATLQETIAGYLGL